jgi:hypothetical protein
MTSATSPRSILLIVGWGMPVSASICFWVSPFALIANTSSRGSMGNIPLQLF